ncbi:hypothetical protein [Geodermatophilus sp. DF01_2]|nr:hypothetical protein [Geodermatophilus sp. DF01_2]
MTLPAPAGRRTARPVPVVVLVPHRYQDTPAASGTGGWRPG